MKWATMDPSNAPEVPKTKISRMPRLMLGNELTATDANGIATVCLSRPTHSSHLRLTEDRMTMYSRRGYRMCRATHGVVYGRWYFEVKVTHLGATGHSRVGWAGDRAELQAPVGYDAHSYAYRDINGVKVHAGHRKWYGEPYSVGDVLGCLLVLPEREDMPPCRAPQLAKYKHELVVLREDGDEKYQHRPLPGSRVAFFKNGVCQGVAYENTLCEDVYFPAGSLYTDKNIEGDDAPPASLTFNFGPDFAFPPQGVRFAQPVRAEGDAVGVPAEPSAAATGMAEGPACAEAGGNAEGGGEAVRPTQSPPKPTEVMVDGRSISVDGVRPVSEAVHFEHDLNDEVPYGPPLSQQKGEGEDKADKEKGEGEDKAAAAPASEANKEKGEGEDKAAAAPASEAKPLEGGARSGAESGAGPSQSK